MPVRFFDTNVLLYVASGDTEKADGAEAVIAGGELVSVQVLNEIATVVRRKMQLSRAETHAFLNALRGLLTVDPLTVKIHEIGLALAARYGFAIYEAIIAASALHAGCDTLWSEGLEHGMAA